MIIVSGTQIFLILLQHVFILCYKTKHIIRMRCHIFYVC